MDSHGFVEHSVLASWPVIPRRISVSVSGMPSRSEPAASGQVRLQLARQLLEPLLGEVGVLERPRAADPCQDRGAVALGQQIGDVALLVPMAAVHERVLAEHVLDRAADRLPSVNHKEDRLLGIQAAVDEIGQQRAGERGVLGRALPQPEWDLHALGANSERDDVCALSDVHAVEHHHRQAHVVQPAAHQLTERGAGPFDEHLRDGALRRRAGLPLDLLA